MEENTLNAGAEEVVQPQTTEVENALDTNASEEGVVQPQDEGAVNVSTEESNIPQPFRSFGTQEEYQSEIDKIVGARLGDMRSVKEQADMFAGVKSLMCRMFNTENEEEALQAFENSVYETIAGQSGIPVDTQRQLATQEKELNAFKAAAQENERSERIAGIIEGWRKQEQEFKKDVPDFSLDTEFQSEMFSNYVMNQGLSIADAYYLTHRSDILKEASSVGAATAVNNLQHNNNRPAENGAGGATGGTAGVNVATMSDSDIDKILERVKNGERVDFK